MKQFLIQAMQNILEINYFGYFTPLGGYGISNLNWVKHLERQGVVVFPHSKFIPDPSSFEYSILTEEEKEILNRDFEKKRIGIIETTPFDFGTIDTEIKIASTMCESDLIGASWVGACNSMDYVVVPNEFQRSVFAKSGVDESKLKVIRSGTETERFPYFKRPVRDIYTFGIVGYMNERKGVFELIQAFCSEFERWESVRLYIKTSNKDFAYYSNFTDKRIVVDSRHLSMQDLNKIYQGFDCFVFPSKAEGIGQPPREAMSTGLPTIVTNYSGLEEICDEEYCYPIQPMELRSGENPHTIEQPGNWAYIDIQELMYTMRYVFEHPEEADEKGKKASLWIKNEHSWSRAAKNMVDFLKEL